MANVTGEKTAPSFLKEQLLTSAKYAKRRDLLSVLLEDGKRYSANDVDKLINNFMKGVV